MLEIVEPRGLTQCSSEIQDSPPTKRETIDDILARLGVAPELAVFIGDSVSDLRAATESGVSFLPSIAKPDWFADRPTRTWTRISPCYEAVESVRSDSVSFIEDAKKRVSKLWAINW